MLFLYNYWPVPHYFTVGCVEYCISSKDYLCDHKIVVVFPLTDLGQYSSWFNFTGARLKVNFIRHSDQRLTSKFIRNHFLITVVAYISGIVKHSWGGAYIIVYFWQYKFIFIYKLVIIFINSVKCFVIFIKLILTVHCIIYRIFDFYGNRICRK